MSLSAALRASAAATATTPAVATGEATPVAKTTLDATTAAARHFFPLPRAPLWRRRVLSGTVLPPPTSGASLTLLNHGRTLVLFGGLHGQRATQHAAPAAVAQLDPDFFLLDAKAAPGEPVRVLSGGPRTPTLGVAGNAASSTVETHAVRVAHAAVKLSEHALLVNGGWNGAKYVASGVVLDLATMTLLFEHNNARGLGPGATLPATGLLAETDPRTLPPPRRDHSLVSLHSKAFLLFGGWDGEDTRNDMWICRLAKSVTGTTRSWIWSLYPYAPSNTIALQPSPRRGACMMRVGRRVFLFGGLSGYSTYRDDLHILDLPSRTWSRPSASSYAGTPPSPRAWAGVAVIGVFLLVFGGVGANGFLNDLHLLDTEGRRWYHLAQTGEGEEMPAPRASAAVELVGSTLWIHGGFTRRTVTEAGVGGATKQVVVPCDELWTLETFLPSSPEEEYISSDDESEDEDDTITYDESAATI